MGAKTLIIITYWFLWQWINCLAIIRWLIIIIVIAFCSLTVIWLSTKGIQIVCWINCNPFPGGRFKMLRKPKDSIAHALPSSLCYKRSSIWDMQHFTSQPWCKGKTSEETSQIGRQWPNGQISLAARCTVCGLQITNIAPVLNVLPFVSASITTLLGPGGKTYYAAQVFAPMASLWMFLVEVL